MAKIDYLKETGTYNPGSSSVLAEEFQHGIFFDPDDLIQVKYEMLRSVEKKELSVSEASAKYGLSRQTYYLTRAAVQEGGIMALLPKKTGPKQPFKLNDEGRRFIDSYLSAHPGAGSREINAAMKTATGISLHDKTISRYLSKKRQGSR